MNLVWFWLIAISVVVAAFNGRMEELTTGSFESAKTAVNLAIGLIGAMALWLGLVKIVEEAGLMELVAGLFRRVLVRLFPQVPERHTAMSAMVMNLSANALGLGNAATPLGIKAMVELDKLNPEKGRATSAMCLFLAINTSSVTLLPLGVIGVRAAAGASEPASIIIPTLFATICSTAVAITACKLFERFYDGSFQSESILNSDSADGPSEDNGQNTNWTPTGNGNESKGLYPPGPVTVWAVRLLFVLILAAALWKLLQGPFLPVMQEIVSFWIVPVLMLAFAAYGYIKGVPVYEAGSEGAKEGFNVAVKIIPFLVMILVAVGMFRASGAFDFLSALLSPVTGILGFPADVLPVALLRPLSGSGAFGLMSEIVSRAPDSFSAYLASTLQGSTETTFYVLAVYFGAVGIKDPRHAVAAALSADLAGALAALFICRLTY